MLFPDRFSHLRCGRSLSPSMYPILLFGRLRTVNCVSRDTPIILTRRLLATDSYGEDCKQGLGSSNGSYQWICYKPVKQQVENWAKRSTGLTTCWRPGLLSRWSSFIILFRSRMRVWVSSEQVKLWSSFCIPLAERSTTAPYQSKEGGD